MLPLILSRFFKLVFFLFIIGALGNIISQIILKPFEIKTGKGSWLNFGNPGLQVVAKGDIKDESNAPDTSVKYKIQDKDGNIRGSGTTYTSSERPFYNGGDELKREFEAVNANGKQIILDTEINTITQPNFRGDSGFISSVDSLSLKDGRAVFVQKTYAPATQKTVIHKDTFANTIQANRFLQLNAYKSPNAILEENNVTETLRILPANKWQHVFMILYQTIIFTCWAMLFLILSRLFKNFYFKKFFTKINITILQQAGWCLLSPQILNLILYSVFFVWINPVKIFISYPSNDFKIISYYHIQTGTEWELVFLGLGMIVLSYIFKNGLTLKEEQEFTI